MSEAVTTFEQPITGEQKIHRPSIESLMETSARLERMALYLTGEGATREAIFDQDIPTLLAALTRIQGFLRSWRGKYYQAMPYTSYKAGIAEHPSTNGL